MTEQPHMESSHVEKLEDKVVLLIGGTGIGDHSLSVSLAEGGANIAIVYLGEQHCRADRIKRQIEALGRRCLIISLASDEKSASRDIIDQIVDDLGQIDIFIDYAATPDPKMNGAALDDNDQRNQWSKPFSHYELLSAALKQMVGVNQTAAYESKSEIRRNTMRIAQKFINMPVIGVKEGQELGKVQDFYLDPELGSITAAYLGKDGLLSRKETLVKWENVVTLGTDALLITEADAVLETDQTDEIDNYIRRDDLIGRAIDTPGGTKIGRIGDVVIDQDAAIAGFSLSQIFVSGPIAANQAISRSAILDTGNEDGVMTAKIAAAEEANLKVVFEGLFADPSVAPTETVEKSSA